MLRRALDKLEKIGVVPGIERSLQQGRSAVVDRLVRTVIEEIAAFSASGNPDVLPELERHAAEHVAEMCRLLDGGVSGNFQFVRSHAQQRAGQKFPLEATLHAYRCGHKVLSIWMRDAASASGRWDARQAISALADFAIEYTDAISTIATSEYVAEVRRIAEAEGDIRTELLNILMSGYDESDGRVGRMLRQAGYLEQRKSYCIAVSQSVDPSEMESPPRVQRIVAAFTDVATQVPGRLLCGVRDNMVVAVFSNTRRLSGWTVPQTTLAAQVRPALLQLGPAVIIGVSTDKPSTSHIPRALSEARIALEFASVTDRVVQYADIPVRQMIIRLARDNMQSALPVWVDEFLAVDSKARGTLTSTIEAYADADMNVLQAAKILAVHPNTIYARMQRISDLTGLNPLTYHALTELLLAADCRKL